MARHEIISRAERARRDPGGLTRVTLIGDAVLFPMTEVETIAGGDRPYPDVLSSVQGDTTEEITEPKGGI